MHTADQIDSVRKYRLGQAEERGIIDAARSWLTMPRDVYGTSRAEFIDDEGTIAAECRDGHVRVWFDPNAAAFNAVTPISAGSSTFLPSPATTPEANLVLEVVQETVEIKDGMWKYVLEGYVPGEWEPALFRHVSGLLLDRRLQMRSDAIIAEQREQDERRKQARRWDV